MEWKYMEVWTIGLERLNMTEELSKLIKVVRLAIQEKRKPIDGM